MTGAGRKFLTDVTWSSVGGMISSSTGLAWDRAADLGYLLSDRVRLLDDDQCRSLVGAVLSGMPVVLTWEARGVVEDTVEVTRATVLARYLTAPSLRPDGTVQPSLPGRVHVSYTGFTHDVYLDRVVNVEMPHCTRVTTHAEESRTYFAEPTYTAPYVDDQGRHVRATAQGHLISFPARRERD